jgi:BirA family biotin operon repressor/biotin-[acetyl-CoA-carboxylase] ligase
LSRKANLGAGMDTLNFLSVPAIRHSLGTEFVGQSLYFWPQVGSTNEEARRLAREGAPEGTLVLTEYQESGRGRLDRRWVAPPASSLLLSLVFRPPLAPHQIQRLTMACGLAVAEAIESETGLTVGLKWPNDIVVERAKLGGILTEIELQGQRVDYAVVGIGLNVNLDPGRLPEDLLASATSLSHLLGHDVARLPLLRRLLQAIEARYLALRTGRSPHSEWTERLVNLGRPVVVSTPGSDLQGVAEGVNPEGALLVRLADGRLETVVAGDVTLLSVQVCPAPA